MIEIKDSDTGTTTYFYQIGEVAKILGLRTEDGKVIGRNNAFKVFKYNGIICQDNTPKQSLINLGMAISHKTIKRYKTYAVTMFSERGINYLQRQFDSGKFIVYYEPTIKKQGLKLDDVC